MRRAICSNYFKPAPPKGARVFWDYHPNHLPIMTRIIRRRNFKMITPAVPGGGRPVLPHHPGLMLRRRPPLLHLVQGPFDRALVHPQPETPRHPVRKTAHLQFIFGF